MNGKASDLGDVKLSYSFIIVGLLSLLFFLSLYFTEINMLRLGIYRINDVWVLAHLFILGFLMHTVMGVMYQLLPVTLLVPIYSNKLAWLQFGVFFIGYAGLIYGFWVMDTWSMFIFGSIAFTGVLLFITNMALSIKSLKKWSWMSVIIGTALFYLFMNVLFGLLLVINYYYNLWPNAHNDILYSHITFGLIGWLTTVIMGFSYKMAPMFALSHGYSEKFAKWIYIFLQAGIISVFIGLFADINWLIWSGLLLAIVGYLFFVLQLREIIKKRLKTNLDIGFRVSIYSVYFTGIILILAPIGFLVMKESFILPFVYLFITAWIGLSILGYLFKIVPFLVWTDKYSEKVGKEPVPMLKDMVDEKKGKLAFILIFAGIIGNAVGMGLHIDTIMLIGSISFLLGGLLYSYLTFRVFRV